MVIAISMTQIIVKFFKVTNVGNSKDSGEICKILYEPGLLFHEGGAPGPPTRVTNKKKKKKKKQKKKPPQKKLPRTAPTPKK